MATTLHYWLEQQRRSDNFESVAAALAAADRLHDHQGAYLEGLSEGERVVMDRYALLDRIHSVSDLPEEE
ncbi:thymidylate kinase [Deinobacterium chartae]|uniref:Thymidylate kinase n=1 Tax=Deinobacterium chartae TaxID=521158 RepID=A0A841I807_9DEIO|nr:hypothetical protein [Deinobacterium chartae]MBB6099935.1 thymidylate kinase [Deinobacterium chartae]